MDQIILLKNDVRYNSKGKVYKYAIVSNKFKKISEVYFSKVEKNKIKAWKKNKTSKQFFYVIEGSIILRIIDDRKKKIKVNKINLGKKFKYSRVIIPKDVWYGFKGLDKNNLIANCLTVNHKKCKMLSSEIKNKNQQFVWK